MIHCHLSASNIPIRALTTHLQCISASPNDPTESLGCPAWSMLPFHLVFCSEKVATLVDLGARSSLRKIKIGEAHLLKKQLKHGFVLE